MVLIKVGWYKPSGKWYASEELNIPNSLTSDILQEYIVANQRQLSTGWTNGDWYVACTVLYQSTVDTRFFERMFKYGSCK